MKFIKVLLVQRKRKNKMVSNSSCEEKMDISNVFFGRKRSKGRSIGTRVRQSFSFSGPQLSHTTSSIRVAHQPQELPLTILLS